MTKWLNITPSSHYNNLRFFPIYFTWISQCTDLNVYQMLDDNDYYLPIFIFTIGIMLIYVNTGCIKRLEDYIKYEMNEWTFIMVYTEWKLLNARIFWLWSGEDNFWKDFCELIKCDYVKLNFDGNSIWRK